MATVVRAVADAVVMAEAADLEATEVVERPWQIMLSVQQERPHSS
jgi:hypothetical protein